MEKIKLFELFSGYGGASFSLKNANIDFDCVGHSEIDKYAIECYNQNHSNIKNYGDITKIDEKELPNFDLLTGGFPCQSFSQAGKGLGELDTRGTLFNDIIRIAEHKKPKYILLENVKGLFSKKHEKTFDKIVCELKRIGYVVYYRLLNSKNFGTPQNRERIFFICYRQDIHKLNHANFLFPSEKKLNIFINDILEENVDEKFYLSHSQIKRVMETKFNSRKALIQKKNICSTLLARDYKEPKIIFISSLQKNNTIRSDGLSNTLPSAMGLGGGHTPMINKEDKFRKITPKECFRLMGFLDDEINLQGLSNTQKYKLAGNGWDVNLVSQLFVSMFKGD